MWLQICFCISDRAEHSRSINAHIGIKHHFGHNLAYESTTFFRTFFVIALDCYAVVLSQQCVKYKQIAIYNQFIQNRIPQMKMVLRYKPELHRSLKIVVNSFIIFSILFFWLQAIVLFVPSRHDYQIWFQSLISYLIVILFINSKWAEARLSVGPIPFILYIYSSTRPERDVSFSNCPSSFLPASFPCSSPQTGCLLKS